MGLNAMVEQRKVLEGRLFLFDIISYQRERACLLLGVSLFHDPQSCDVVWVL